MKRLILTAALIALSATGCATTPGHDPNNMLSGWADPAADGLNSALRMIGR